MLGDNRDSSFDSRYLGFIPDEYVVGSARRVMLSCEPATGSIRRSRLGGAHPVGPAPDTTGAPPVGFVVQEGSRPPALDSIRIPGSPLILTRGEPVRITVHNHLTTPLSVHWHGIELDSYSDCVGDFSGAGKRIAPMIAPKDSFVVRFTPPRAGTFMYHVHGERGEELASGLYAPLIVLEPGATFDARTDRVFILAAGGPGEGRPTSSTAPARLTARRWWSGPRIAFASSPSQPMRRS